MSGLLSVKCLLRQLWKWGVFRYLQGFKCLSQNWSTVMKCNTYSCNSWEISFSPYSQQTKCFGGGGLGGAHLFLGEGLLEVKANYYSRQEYGEVRLGMGRLPGGSNPHPLIKWFPLYYVYLEQKLLLLYCPLKIKEKQ